MRLLEINAVFSDSNYVIKACCQCSIGKVPGVYHVIAWRRAGNKPLPEARSKTNLVGCHKVSVSYTEIKNMKFTSTNLTWIQNDSNYQAFESNNIIDMSWVRCIILFQFPWLLVFNSLWPSVITTSLCSFIVNCVSLFQVSPAQIWVVPWICELSDHQLHEPMASLVASNSNR